MSNSTPITIIGNLTDDPELRFTPSGAAVANFTVAVTPRSFNKQKNEWEDGETAFYRCAVWRQAAENVAESLLRGMRVIVTGALKIRSYETKDNRKGISVEVEVDEVGPSVKFATAKVARAGGGGGGGQRGGGQQQQPPADDPWATSSPARSDDPWGAPGPVARDEEPPF